MHEDTRIITKLILNAEKNALRESDSKSDTNLPQSVRWPINCTVGPGLEGAIACETKIGYVNGTKGQLIYRGYDVFDLCAYSSYEEVTYLLINGRMPSLQQLKKFKKTLLGYMYIPDTTRLLASFPIEEMDPMAALRFGISLLHLNNNRSKKGDVMPSPSITIGADEDSIAMETPPKGEAHAVYEFDEAAKENGGHGHPHFRAARIQSCYRLISGVAALTSAIARIKMGHLPLEPVRELSHAGNLIYMMTGREPSPVEERVMDVCLILHADHGMNASTFAAMVVASTLSDMYFSIGSGVGALSGPLHGGANRKAYEMLKEIGGPENVKTWYEKARSENKKIMGVGHRVYKTHDPRALILGPLAGHLVKKDRNMAVLHRTAKSLEKEICSTLGVQKKLFPNVDFYSGIVYSAMGIPQEMFTPIFAVSRVAGWTARVLEYLETNRIFRPRALYAGPFDRKVSKHGQ
jgi:citrate synthase